MKTLLKVLIVCTFADLAPPSVLNAEGLFDKLGVEAVLSGGNTDNLLQDSSDFKESYTTAGASFKLYPFSSTEITLLADYNNYTELNSLDNFRYRGEIRMIPTGDSSRFTLYLYGAYDTRDYKAKDLGVNTADFNTLSADAMISGGYQLSPASHLRGGLAYKLSGYDNEFVEDKYTVDLFAGFNRTIMGNLSFDLESGFTTGNLEYTPRSVSHVGPVQLGWQQGGGLDTSFTVYDSLEDGSLKSFYISPRISRSIGEKTGLSLTFSYRTFLDKVDSSVVFGYSTGILSPWVTDYEGEAVLLSLKSFLIPRLITTVTFGYWHRSHLPTVEQAWLEQEGTDPIAKGWQEPSLAKDRTDVRRRTMLQLQWPFASRSGWFLEPFVTFEYSNNNSSIVVYEYDNFSVSGGINVRL